MVYFVFLFMSPVQKMDFVLGVEFSLLIVTVQYGKCEFEIICNYPRQPLSLFLG